ncbi:C40 family peptidase [Nocardiopsis xinjiangensis]|uniref:C40 family peptidase n=1 Tax=Nocardiopsis xinjiangensis TaxID=124285 RepID=UPI00034A96EC|nr:C40 family peptidase [Nocardiopsis xinjiangensis]
MYEPRHHEQIKVCRTRIAERQARPDRNPTRGARALTAAALAAAALAAGAAPAAAHAAQTPSSPPTPSAERVHQSLADATVEEAINAAESQAGTPYAWGGTGPDSFDCSGLVQWAFGEAGIDLPRITYDQVAQGSKISYDNAQRGDILYWSDGGPAYHVAIYLGDGRMIDAPNSGGQVGERDVHHANLAGAVRLG